MVSDPPFILTAAIICVRAYNMLIIDEVWLCNHINETIKYIIIGCGMTDT